MEPLGRILFYASDLRRISDMHRKAMHIRAVACIIAILAGAEAGAAALELFTHAGGLRAALATLAAAIGTYIAARINHRRALDLAQHLQRWL